MDKKKQKSINGPNLEKLWLHFNLLCFKKRLHPSKCISEKNQKCEKTVCCSPSLMSAENDKAFSFAEMTQLLFFWGKTTIETALTVQWQILVYFSDWNFQSILCKRDTEKQLSNMQNLHYSSTNKDTPLTPLLMQNCCLLNITLPSETHHSFTTVLTQTNDFLWWMHSV